MKKTPQEKARDKWNENNKERRKIYNAKSATRRYIREFAEMEDIEEVRNWLEEKEIILKGEKIMKNLVKIFNIKVEIENGMDVEENIEELKELLEGADLNQEITVHYCESSDTYFYEGNITKNWEKLIEGNWNGDRYAAHVGDDDMYSTSLVEWLTSENNDDIINLIEELDPEFKAVEKMSAYLSLKDLVDEKGYLKAKVLDDRYLITNDNEYGILKWLDDHEEDPEAEFKFKTRDILKDEDVYFLIKADQRETFVNDGGIGACKIELVK